MVIFITKILVLFYVGQISFLEKVECKFCLKGCVARINVERGMAVQVTETANSKAREEKMSKDYGILENSRDTSFVLFRDWQR